MRTREDVVSSILDVLARRGEGVAVAESLTGGLLCGALIDVPGASQVVLGGVIAYATEAKASMLGVEDDLLATHGAVDAEVARQMAVGVRDRFGATWAVATTGVAGPEPAGDKPAGTVFVAVAGPSVEMVRALNLVGGRTNVREATVDAGLSLLLATLEEQSTGSSG